MLVCGWVRGARKEKAGSFSELSEASGTASAAEQAEKKTRKKAPNFKAKKTIK